MVGWGGGTSVRYFVVTERAAVQLAFLRVGHAHLCLHNGQIVTIPVD